VTNTIKAHLFILSANILYGINYSVGKIALETIDPFGIVVIRVSVSLFLFWLIHALFIKEPIRVSDHGRLMIAGLFGVAVNQLL
jgi:drug/metabolite transporter (DMT)-like permease